MRGLVDLDQKSEITQICVGPKFVLKKLVDRIRRKKCLHWPQYEVKIAGDQILSIIQGILMITLTVCLRTLH